MKTTRALIMLPVVVTILLLTSIYSVTTAAAQAVAPGQCEWPVAGNLLLDGDFSDPSGAAWWLFDSGSGLTHQVVVTDHPCMYGFATGNGWATQFITVSSQSATLTSFWSRNNQPLVSDFDFTHNHFSRWHDDYNPVSTPFGFEQDLGVWTFHSICVPGHESIAEDVQRVYWKNNIANDVRDITGISIVVVDSCEPDPVPSPTPTLAPTAVVLSTDPRALPVRQSYNLPGLPALPEAFVITAPEHTLELTGLFEMVNITLVFQIVRTVPALAEQMPGWPLLMFSAVIIISLRFFVRHNRRTRDIERAEERRENAIGTETENNRSEGL